MENGVIELVWASISWIDGIHHLHGLVLICSVLQDRNDVIDIMSGSFLGKKKKKRKTDKKQSRQKHKMIGEEKKEDHMT